MRDERDEMIERIGAALRAAPAVDATAKARLLVAVAAERERAREAAPIRRRNRRLAAVVGMAAAMVGAAWLTLSRAESARLASPLPVAAVVAPASGSTSARLAARGAEPSGEAALQQVQLVFRDPAAHRVAVVGDFTGWDAGQSPMVQDSASGLWSVTVALAPGRHVYAFLVDDTLWVRDPRAMEAQDADFGRPGSVLLVGGR